MSRFKCFLFLCVAGGIYGKSVHPDRSVYGRESERDGTFMGRVEQAQNLIRNGIEAIKDNLNKYKSNSRIPQIEEEQWNLLNKTVEKYLNRLRERSVARNSISPQGAVWHTFVSDFQSLSGAFIKNVTKQQQNKPNGKGETIIVVVLENGFGNIVKGLQDLQKLVDENNNDENATGRSGQLPKSIFSWIGGQNSEANQNDVNNPPKNQRPLQALASHIGETFSNFSPFGRPQPQSDDGASGYSANGTTIAPVESTTSPRPLQLLASQLGQAFISNIIPPVPTDDDDDDDDSAEQNVSEEVPSSSQRPLQAIAGQISQAIQQFNNFVFRPNEEEEEDESEEETPQKPIQRPPKPSHPNRKPTTPKIPTSTVSSNLNISTITLKNDTIDVSSTEPSLEEATEKPHSDAVISESIPVVVVSEDLSERKVNKVTQTKKTNHPPTTTIKKKTPRN